ncbi:hypothetical protein D8M04_03615 [Oceanobacillus piezotolerans]|uniref:Uncharacterized protein n=1 Tax=Oceanobacillus piezotolerans TaxID=2448030 RepID=A0A498DBH2_9BACI|nr:hypothetical protein [Oceanobacillus piezotolerans]RLL48361.1 hypothetical protein D8M04_03615 [Oceanobacillus piezotolerans]
MEFELTLKNKRVRVWLWLMIPAFIFTLILFIYLPEKFSIAPVLPIIIGYFTYICWVFMLKKNRINLLK